MITISELKKMDCVGVHCDTEEKLEKLQKALGKINAGWGWSWFKENTCYYNTCEFSDINTALKSNYKVFNFENINFDDTEQDDLNQENKNLKLHTLKIKPEYYLAVIEGFKTFELRKNDRDYQVQDLIHFVNTNGEEFDKEPDNVYQISYVLKDVPEYGLNKDYCILGIKKVSSEVAKCGQQ